MSADATDSGRVLVFIVAYQAEKHLAGVLSRIPREMISNPQYEILVIDDGSSDQGVVMGRKWAEETSATNVTILRNPVNQGYGGNQKLGYRIAIDSGFDLVILLHGDGQYAPELLMKFVEVRRTTGADVILGSRMKDLLAARKGGMPWYKLFGNRTLTNFQNKVTHQAISEYHTGYRAYSTAFLKKVPFEINTNDFHFDTEILLQAFHVKARVEEFAIPTHYGDEICRVNGMRYAKDVVFSTLRFKMHQLGMLCDLKYRRIEPERYEEKTYLAYSSHAIALALVDKYKPATVLDIGCGPGFVARECRRRGIEVTGVDMSPPLADTVHHFRQANLEQDPPMDSLQFDMVLLLDVIEHLAEPEDFMVRLRNSGTLTSPEQKMPVFVISTPNIAFAAIRLNLLLGRFNYAERGILDITHKRLFTRKALLVALRDCGYDVLETRAAGVPFGAVTQGIMGRMLGAVSGVMARMWPSMFAFQTIVVCRPKAGVRQLIQISERHNTVSPVFRTVLGESSEQCAPEPGART